MPYIVINQSNNFDPIHQNHYPSEALADEAARELLKAQPMAIVRTAKLLKNYTAEVTVSVKEADAVETVVQTEES